METFLTLVLDLARVVWKALRVNVTVHLCLEFAGSGGIWSCAPMLLFRPFGSGGSGASILCYHHVNFGHGEVRDGEYREGQIGGLAMEVRVSTLLRDLIGVLDFAAV
jgi:hypothetical protein